MNVRTVVLSLCLFLSNLPAFSQDEKEFNRKQYAGWTGIVFRCIPDEEDDKILEMICQSIAADARLMAANAKIPFLQSKDTSPFSMFVAAAKLGYPIILEAHLYSTKGTYRGIRASLTAGSFYSAAIDQSDPAGSPERQPRAGTLILWESGVIASGYFDQDFAQSFADLAATYIKNFFADFIEARN